MNATTIQRLTEYAMQLGEATSGDAQDCHRVARAIVHAAKTGCPLDVLIRQTAAAMGTFVSGSEEWAKLGCLQSILVGNRSWVFVAKCVAGN